MMELKPQFPEQDVSRMRNRRFDSFPSEPPPPSIGRAKMNLGALHYY